jgi:hypothetical protein
MRVEIENQQKTSKPIDLRIQLRTRKHRFVKLHFATTNKNLKSLYKECNPTARNN